MILKKHKAWKIISIAESIICSICIKQMKFYHDYRGVLIEYDGKYIHGFLVIGLISIAV